MNLILSFFMLITPVYGIDFEKNENYYIKLCTTRNKSTTCKQFNRYLVKKKEKIKENIDQTQHELDELKRKQDEINQSLVSKENEIKNIETKITQLSNDLNIKKDYLGQHIYFLQSYYNYHSPLSFINKKSSLSEYSCINEIINYNGNYVKNIETTQHHLSEQKKELEKLRETILNEKDKLSQLEVEYTNHLISLNSDLNQKSYQQSRIDIALGYFSSQDNHNFSSFNAKDIISKTALTKKGTRYWWGMTGPDFFDCSGFVYWTFNHAGYKIPRLTAREYAKYGQSVSSPHPGDIVTFQFGNHVSHIGIYLGDNRFIHASGKGSSTHGQDANQCVKISQLSGFYLNHVYNYRRFY